MEPFATIRRSLRAIMGDTRRIFPKAQAPAIDSIPDHAPDCRYIGFDLWDCGKEDNSPELSHCAANWDDWRGWAVATTPDSTTRIYERESLAVGVLRFEVSHRQGLYPELSESGQVQP